MLIHQEFWVTPLIRAEYRFGRNPVFGCFAGRATVLSGPRAMQTGPPCSAEVSTLGCRCLSSGYARASCANVACNLAKNSLDARVNRHGDALRRAGLRPVQILVPDTRRTDFVKQCRVQSGRVGAANRADPGLLQFLEDALTDVDG